MRGFDDLAVHDFSNTSVSPVKEKLPNPECCEFRVGYFPETANGMEKERFCFVNIDAGLFDPIYDGLCFFYERLSKGGFIMVHDYYQPQVSRRQACRAKVCF